MISLHITKNAVLENTIFVPEKFVFQIIQKHWPLDPVTKELTCTTMVTTE